MKINYKRLFKITIVVLLVVGTYCYINQERQRYSVRIALAYRHLPYIDYTEIKGHYYDSIYNDIFKNAQIVQYNRILEGETTIRVFSLLTASFKQNINVSHDTFIPINTSEYDDFDYTSDFEKFSSLLTNLPDTFYIGQTVHGCFRRSAEKLMIIKLMENEYKINYYNNDNYFAEVRSSSFINHFNQFITQSAILFKNKQDRYPFLNLSTTSIKTYIRIGHHVLKFPDLDDWNGIASFKEQIGIPKMQNLDSSLQHFF